MIHINFISLTISLISISISIYTFWKTRFDEKMRYDLDILNVFSPEGLVSPLAGIVYIECVVTNKSTLPLVLISSELDIKQHGMLNTELKTKAFMFDSIISTTITTGQNGDMQGKKVADGLPITIRPKDAVHFILAFPAPDILGVDKSNTKMTLEFTTNRDELIKKDSKEIEQAMITLEQFLKERAGREDEIPI